MLLNCILLLNRDNVAIDRLTANDGHHLGRRNCRADYLRCLLLSRLVNVLSEEHRDEGRRLNLSHELFKALLVGVGNTLDASVNKTYSLSVLDVLAVDGGVSYRMGNGHTGNASCRRFHSLGVRLNLALGIESKHCGNSLRYTACTENDDLLILNKLRCLNCNKIDILVVGKNEHHLSGSCVNSVDYILS